MRTAGDERARPLALRNMCEAMLPELAHKAPWALERCAGELDQARDDYDSADRREVQRAAIGRVRAMLEEGI